MNTKGITVVSPMYGDMTVTNRMVMSVITQFISKKNPFKIHLVLVDDYIEKRGENGESYYDYYLSDEFSKLYDTENIKITIVKNEEHKYQGESREIGWLAGDYPFFVLVDCDDMLAPNCCDKYISILREEDSKQGSKPISCIQGLLYGFDTNGYTQLINGDSIWVQSRCYNRDFIVKNGIHFPTGTNSRQGEDYPFMRKLDYAIAHDQNFNCVNINFNDHSQHIQCTAYWFPNEDSLSRKDPHYGQHLSGWTMASSNAILDFYEEYNRLNGFEIDEDEYLKHETLNMTCYSYFNLLDFVKEVSSTDYEPIEEDWYAVRDNTLRLKERLKEKYWDEIVYSDVENMLYVVRNHSDCRTTESWIGTFYDYMNIEQPLHKMSYDEMIDYAHSLKFDSANHEIHAPYVQAWANRHDVSMSELEKQAEKVKKDRIRMLEDQREEMNK